MTMQPNSPVPAFPNPQAPHSPSAGHNRTGATIGASIAAITVIILVKAVVITAVSSFFFGDAAGDRDDDNQLIEARNAYVHQVEEPAAAGLRLCFADGRGSPASKDCREVVAWKESHRAQAEAIIARLSRPAHDERVEEWRLSALAGEKVEHDAFLTLSDAVARQDARLWATGTDGLRSAANTETKTSALAKKFEG